MARLAQSVERETFNLKAKGSSPLSGEFFLNSRKNVYLTLMFYFDYLLSSTQVIH